MPSKPHAARAVGRGWLRNNNRPGNPDNAPRCGARTRSGTPCKGPAMANGRCRMHGGPSTGPRTPEGIERIRSSRWKHGRFSKSAVASRREMRETIRALRNLLKDARP